MARWDKPKHNIRPDGSLRLDSGSKQDARTNVCSTPGRLRNCGLARRNRRGCFMNGDRSRIFWTMRRPRRCGRGRTNRTRFGGGRLFEGAEQCCCRIGRFIKHLVTFGFGTVTLMPFLDRCTHCIRQHDVPLLTSRWRTMNAHGQPTPNVKRKCAVRQPVHQQISKQDFIVAVLWCLCRVEFEARRRNGRCFVGHGVSGKKNAAQQAHHQKNHHGGRLFRESATLVP